LLGLFVLAVVVLALTGNPNLFQTVALLRGLLSPVGHGTWTAILASGALA